MFDLVKDKADYPDDAYDDAYSNAIRLAQSLDFIRVLNAHHIYALKHHNDMLCLAAEVGNLEIVEYELEQGANDYTGALHHAKRNNHHDIAELMISLGANI